MGRHRVAGDRQDYTRQVETQYAADHPPRGARGGTKGYFWEVHDKGGNVFWYGGKPDQGGPDGYNYLDDNPTNDLTPTIDRSAIVTDENGNGVRWLLSAQRDVGVNQISYHYTTVHYQFGAAGWTNVGQLHAVGHRRSAPSTPISPASTTPRRPTSRRRRTVTPSTRSCSSARITPAPIPSSMRWAATST